MIALLACALIALVSSDGIVSNIRDYCVVQHLSFKKNVPRCTIIPQPYFRNTTFWSLDTVYSITMPDDIMRPAIRVGVSSDTTVYSIFGFDIDQFNDLIVQSNIRISATNAYDYGRFFLDLHRDIDQDFRYYATNVDDLVSFNRQIMVDSLQYSHQSKTISGVEQRIRKLLSPFQLGKIHYNIKDGTFRITYIVWDHYLGLLHRFELSIGRNGVCNLELSELIAEDVGYWYNIKM